MIPREDRGFGLQRFINFLARIVFGFAYAPKVTGREHVPPQGGCILAVNHQRIIDPVVLSAYTPRPVFYMAKKELFRIPVLGALFRWYGAFPVDRFGNDIAAVRMAITTVTKNRCVLGLFPEGTRMHDVDLGHIEEGVGLIALRGKVPVIPVFMGRYRFWRRIPIRIGKPVPLDDLMATRTDTAAVTEATRRIAAAIVSLAQKPS